MLVRLGGRRTSYPKVLALAILFLLLAVSASAALRARHKCTSEANVAKVLGYHPECVELLDGPTCSEDSVLDGGCHSTRARNFTVCGTVLYNEVDDPETRRRGGYGGGGGGGASAAAAAAATGAVGGAAAEPTADAAPAAQTFSHCAYAAKPPGAACNIGADAPAAASPSAAARDADGAVSALTGADAGAGDAAGEAAASAVAAAVAAAAPLPPPYVCGGGSLRGMCLPAGSQAPEHEQCVQFSCRKGICGAPVPVNEGRPCGAAAAAPPPPPCRRAACRGGRCVAEPLPDGSPCGSVGPCGEATCRGGECVSTVQEDGVICGPSTVCAEWVCQAGLCVEERRPDGRLCWHAPGACPRTCAAGRCVACECGPAYAFWAGRQHVEGLQWTPFPVDLRESSFGGYFNLLPGELEIPPVQLPYDPAAPPPTAAPSAAAAASSSPPAAAAAAAAGRNPQSVPAGTSVGASNGTATAAAAAAAAAAPSAIVVCSGCRLGLRLQAGGGMVQDGALLTGSVGLAASPVRGGTYVTLDVWLFPNASHNHLLTQWHPWAGLSPPPLNAPHRWGDVSSGRGTALSPPPSPSPPAGQPPGGAGAFPAAAAAAAAGGGQWPAPPGGQLGLLSRPARQHSAWAFVRSRPVHWGFTAQEQVRSVFVGLHLTVAACSKAPPMHASAAAGPAAAAAAGATHVPSSSAAEASAAAPGKGAGSGSGTTGTSAGRPSARAPSSARAAKSGGGADEEDPDEGGGEGGAKPRGQAGSGGSASGRRLSEAETAAAAAAGPPPPPSPPRRIMAEEEAKVDADAGSAR